MAKQNLKAQQKIESKERILNVASRLFKKNGFSATGIDEVMAEAGLTAGGFYAHFKSKNDLLEQTIRHSVANTKKILFKDTEYMYGKEKISEVLKRYLSVQHCERPEKGCIIPALASELHRNGKKSRDIDDYLKVWIDLFEAHTISSESKIEKRKTAVSLVSQAIGAVLLSRIVDDEALSYEILEAAHLR